MSENFTPTSMKKTKKNTHAHAHTHPHTQTHTHTHTPGYQIPGLLGADKGPNFLFCQKKGQPLNKLSLSKKGNYLMSGNFLHFFNDKNDIFCIFY